MSWCTLHIELLGDVRVLHDGRPVPLPASRRSRALLAYLVASQRAHPRERLCELLWEGPDDPRAALRWSLWKLRPLVDDGRTPRLLADRGRVAFEALGADIDVVAVRTALQGGAAAATTEALEQVAARFRGEFLDGLEVPDCYSFREWCAGERESFRSLRIDALATLADRLAGEPERALRYARERAAIDPLSEDAHLRLIELLARLGRHRDAARQYETCRRILESELRATPSARLHRARAALYAHAPIAAAADAHVDPPAPPLPAAVPLLGRERECALLDDALAAASGSGAAEVLLVLGDPGIGKSRLLQHLHERVRDRGGLVLAGRAFEAERTRPYGPWLDALGGGLPRELPDRLRDAVAQLLPEPDRGPAASTNRTQLFEAVARMLDWLAARQPVCVGIDDLQWIDEASVALLHFCARQVRGSLIFALAARSGELEDNPSALRLVRELTRARRLRQLPLGPLARAAIAALVASVDDELDAERIFGASEGHPLYALEMARAATATAADSLDTLIAERLMHLDGPARDLLPWIAALGHSFRIDVLAEATQLPPGALTAALAELERRAVLRAADEGHDFAHDLIRQAAYRRTAAPQRRLIHARIAAVLAARDDPTGALAIDVARHADLGGESALCAAACVRACERCLQGFAHAEAEALVELGQRHAQRLAHEQRIRLQMRLLSCLVHPGLRLHRPGTLGTQIAELCAEAQDAQLHAECSHGFLLLGRLHHMSFGDIPRARAALLHATELLAQLPPEPNLEPLVEGARCLAFLEVDIARARALFADLSRIRGATATLGYQWGLGLLQFWDGDLDGSHASLQAAVALARQARRHWIEFETLAALAMVELEAGRLDHVIEMRGELDRLADKLGEDGSEGPLAAALDALARLKRGDAGASTAVDAAAHALERADSRYHLAFVLNTAAQLDLAAGRCADAERRADAALRSAEVVDRVSEVRRARLLLAALAAHRGRDDEARRLLAGDELGDSTFLPARCRAILSGLQHLLVG